MDGRTELPLLPDGCSLDGAAGAARLARWHVLAERALVGRRREPGELRLRFGVEGDVRRELVALVEAERSCCSFVSWTLDEREDGVELVVAGRPTDLDRVAAL
ncbi:MAG TPA: hypothetical protein VEL73_09510 [Mycobacteriales bacterium]|nr:hypothetical protein [Mycobacteriales bacterium]